ncbi:hypothetical protein N9263_00500 [Candidatus Marinimicrobia bacterium]|nr:hypothetical protein [Candidatus Neomarinimicrobiota bacterium]
MKIYKRLQEGFTGIDVLLSVVFSSFIFLGMSYVFIDITEKLRVEEIRSDVLKYGNTILNSIESDMVQATRVDYEEFQSYSKIKCTKDDGLTVYSIDPANGILKNGIPLNMAIGSAIRFDNVNSADQLLYEIFRFECDPVGINSNNTNERYGSSIFDVKMYVDIYNTRNELVDEVFFNRRIYAVNNYLNSEI